MACCPLATLSFKQPRSPPCVCVRLRGGVYVWQEVQELSANWRMLKEAESRYVSTKSGLATIAASDDKEIMVPLTASLYVPGRVTDTEKVLVDIGTGYFVEKDVSGAQALLDRKIAVIVANADSIQSVARQKQKNLEVIMDMMRIKLKQNE